MCQLLGMNCNTPTDVRFSFRGFAQRAEPLGEWPIKLLAAADGAVFQPL